MKTAIVIAALAFTGTAAAHVPGHAPKNSQKALLAFQERAYGHASYVATHGTGRPAQWHRAAQRWIKRELDSTRAALNRANIRLGPLSCVSCWDRVAECESHGNWSIATGNGFYGGLQFLPSTWYAYGGGRYASMPHYASRLQQIAVASRMSLGHWPVCGSRY